MKILAEKEDASLRPIATQAAFLATGTVVGGTEKKGALGEKFDFCDPTDRFGQDTFEKAESEMQRLAFSIALKKSGLRVREIEALYAGDLLNQCVGSAYGLLDFDIPYFGLYGACSTSAEGLLLGALSVSAGQFSRVGVVTSSHNCSAERQYRTPIEYGAQKPPSAQWTVTAAGAFLLGRSAEAGARQGLSMEEKPERCVRITEVLPGLVVDSGISDANNMGAAMAPAAANTLSRYFSAGGTVPRDFDAIFTGDLGRFGSSLLTELLRDGGYEIDGIHTDCGNLIYAGVEKPDVNCGGSGCGCSAAVLAAHVLPALARGEWHRVLFVATGAMMSPASLQQSLSIPAIAHLLCFES